MSEPVFGNEKTGSIRDIPMPGKESNTPKPLNLQTEQSKNDQNLKGWKPMNKRTRNPFVKIVSTAILLLGLLFLIGGLLHKATLSITPKQETVEIVTVLKATNDGGDGSVAFARVSPFEVSEELFIKGSVEENVQTKASGKILVKNTTGNQQRFIPRTRFETPDGLTYRTPRSVVIPANGTAEITVTADIPGDEFNSESGLTFTLPGLKGTPGFNSFSATQSGVIDGGFSGVITTATSDEIKAGKKELETRLRDKMKTELSSRITAGYMTAEDFMDISNITFSEKPDQDKGGLSISANGAIEAVMFNQQEFDNFVASSVLKDYTPGQSVTIQNLDKLKMLIATEDFDLQDGEEFEFTLKSLGETGTTFMWNIDKDAIAAAVAGKSSSVIEQGLLPELAGAESVELDVSPFWKSKIPQKVTRIEIQVK